VTDETFEIFDESGRLLGTAPRSRVHRDGLWHRASNVFLFLPDGRLLIQRRQITKDVWPGAWDVSAAEHLQPGESFEQGASRGLREELGVIAADLRRFGEIAKSRLDVPAQRIRDYEFQQSFRTVHAGTITPDPGEVMDTRAITLAELESELLAQPESFTPWFRRRVAALQLFSTGLPDTAGRNLSSAGASPGG
jgi:isopentenyl-diphosphate delta-isomerase type 1